MAIHRKKSVFVRCVSLVLIAVMVIFSARGAVCDDHSSAGTKHPVSAQACWSAFDDGASGECPDCPGDEGADSHTCDSCLTCPCHAALGTPVVEMVYTPLIVSLTEVVPFQFLPEVYLPRFIPPQLLA